MTQVDAFDLLSQRIAFDEEWNCYDGGFEYVIR